MRPGKADARAPSGRPRSRPSSRSGSLANPCLKDFGPPAQPRPESDRLLGSRAWPSLLPPRVSCYNISYPATRAP